MTTMSLQTYRNTVLENGSRQGLIDALKKNEEVSFFFSPDGQEVIYAIKGRCGALPTTWAVLAAGYPTPEVFSTRTATSPTTIGLIELLFRAGGKGAQKVDVVPAKADVHLPRVNAAKWFTEATMNLGPALGRLFPVLPGGENLLANIQAENASVKDKTGKITAAGTRTVHRLYMATAFTLLRNKHNGHDRDGVVALVVDKTGNIVSWGQKNPAVTCWHGETSAILRLGGTLPDGCCIYSTLKPCHMCSGLIHGASGGKAKVFWGQDDPGWAAKETALDKSHTGTVLDGNKDHKNVARALVIGPKKSSLATTLGKSFTDQAPYKHRGVEYNQDGYSSTIDYITTPETASFLEQAQGVLLSKQQKYAKPDVQGGNPHTKAVVDYLIRFLRDAAKVNGI